MKDKLSKKLKLLFVSDDKFPPFRVDVSVLFKEKMVNRGHIIDWILQSEGNFNKSKKIEWDECDAYIARTNNGTSKASRLAKNIYRLANELKLLKLTRKGRYDLIIVKDLFISALFAIVVSRLFKIKLAYWLSYPFPEADIFESKNGTARYPILYWIRGYITKFLLYYIILPASNHIFVQSFQMKKDISLQGIPKEKMTVVPMGVSTDKIPFFGYSADHKPTGKEKIVLYLGTLIRTRRLDFLIRAFKQVLKQDSNAKLYFVGGGEDPFDEKMLKNAALRLGINESVVFTGALPQQKAWEHVKNADVCLSSYYPSPILNSTSPTKLIEYMAMGKAVVVNDHPEQRLIISESKAGFCVPYNETAFAEAILYLINNIEDAKEMGFRGRQYVESNRDYDKIAGFVEKKLLQIHNTNKFIRKEV